MEEKGEKLDLTNVWGLPFVFKEVEIHPIKLEQMTEFYDCVDCLLIPKNTLKDTQVLKMSYLKFILYISEASNNFDLIAKLKKLIKLVTKIDPILDEKDGRLRIYLNEKMIKEYDFDKIRLMIFQQNLIRNREHILDPELRQKLEEADAFLAKKSRGMADLEQQVIAYHCLTGLDYSKIKDLTIYQFVRGMERFNLIKNYEVLTYPLMKAGKGKDIKHWLASIQDNDGALMNKNEFMNSLDKDMIKQSHV